MVLLAPHVCEKLDTANITPIGETNAPARDHPSGTHTSCMMSSGGRGRQHLCEHIRWAEAGVPQPSPDGRACQVLRGNGGIAQQQLQRCVPLKRAPAYETMPSTSALCTSGGRRFPQDIQGPGEADCCGATQVTPRMLITVPTLFRPGPACSGLFPVSSRPRDTERPTSGCLAQPRHDFHPNLRSFAPDLERVRPIWRGVDRIWEVSTRLGLASTRLREDPATLAADLAKFGLVLTKPQADLTKIWTISNMSGTTSTKLGRFRPKLQSVSSNLGPAQTNCGANSTCDSSACDEGEPRCGACALGRTRHAPSANGVVRKLPSARLRSHSGRLWRELRSSEPLNMAVSAPRQAHIAPATMRMLPTTPQVQR